jgi:hypothetical protein
VIIGADQEERRGTLARQRPPTVLALLARRVLGTHTRLLPEEQDECDDPSEIPRRPSGRPGRRHASCCRVRTGRGRPTHMDD